MFDKFCAKFLPRYLRLPFHYWLAIWSAPARHATAWQALRITIRAGEYHEKLTFTIKRGTVYA